MALKTKKTFLVFFKKQRKGESTSPRTGTSPPDVERFREQKEFTIWAIGRKGDHARTQYFCPSAKLDSVNNNYSLHSFLCIKFLP